MGLFADAETKVYHVIDRETGDPWADIYGRDRWDSTAALEISNVKNRRLRDEDPAASMRYFVKEVADRRVQWLSAANGRR